MSIIAQGDLFNKGADKTLLGDGGNVQFNKGADRRLFGDGSSVQFSEGANRK